MTKETAICPYQPLSGLNVGFALTGSHCTLAKAIAEMAKLKECGAKLYPIISDSVRLLNTRFGKAEKWREEIIAASGTGDIIDTINKAEPLGPQNLLDILIIAPCSGNTVAKLAAGITDTPVLMAAKANLRNNKPLVISVSTNDGLSGNLKNIGYLMNSKNIFFVPFGQDNPLQKPNSLIADFNKIPDTLVKALANTQLHPLFNLSI